MAFAHPIVGRGPMRLSRRTLLGQAVMGVAFLSARPHVSFAAPDSGPVPPGAWRTWLLTTGDELRPKRPAPPSDGEVGELLDLQAQRTAAIAATVQWWSHGPAVLPWTSIALDLIKVHKPSPVRAARVLALLHVAVYDAVLATWDAQAAHPRAAPSAVNGQIVPLGNASPSPSTFPSEHAAVAAAASTVLAELFPDEPDDGLAALAEEAATSRLWAGACFRSDIEAGLAIGQAVGERAVTRAEADGSDAPWDGSNRPTGDGHWQPTPPGFVQQPLDPLAGTWRPWVIPNGDVYRPLPPPAVNSPAWVAELGAVREAVARRVPEQEAAVHFWAGGPGTVTPAGLWIEIARDLIVADGLDLPHAARVLALTSVAAADSFICCWDAKYAYWTARPITADPSLDVLIPTPPFPSYTSGHSTVSGAAATVLGHLFPAKAVALAAQAAEARDSRLWAGIHYPLDNELGAVGGQQIGRLVVVRARTDGAEVLGLVEQEE